MQPVWGALPHPQKLSIQKDFIVRIVNIIPIPLSDSEAYLVMCGKLEENMVNIIFV